MAESFFPLDGKIVWVAGETGMVGRAITRALNVRGVRVLSAPHRVLDLTDQAATFAWIERYRPDAIFLAAAKVGGIGANSSYPADFMRDNLAIAQNVIEGAHRADVQRLLFLGSSCIYPKMAEQPIREEALMRGPLEPTNEAYAIAKIAGLKMCEFYSRQFGRDYISAMPTNLYGPYDRFDAENGHVIPAMMLKFMQAKDHVTLWGSGNPLREFLHVDDLANALMCMIERYSGTEPVNIGSGEEVSIKTLAAMMQKVTGFQGKVVFDDTKPDGSPRKLLDSSKIHAMGWKPSIALEQGLAQTHAWYNQGEMRRRA